MSANTSTLPVIAAPHGSGVTQDEMNAALRDLIMSKMHDVVSRARVAAKSLEHTLAHTSCSTDDMAKARQQISETILQLEQAHTALTRRLDAYHQVVTEKAGHSDPIDEFAPKLAVL